jgi:hypothetical protein
MITQLFHAILIVLHEVSEPDSNFWWQSILSYKIGTEDGDAPAAAQ